MGCQVEYKCCPERGKKKPKPTNQTKKPQPTDEVWGARFTEIWEIPILQQGEEISVGAREAFSNGCLYLWLARDLQGTREGQGKVCAQAS